MSVVNEYLKKNRDTSRANPWLTKALVCADGFTMSVQASEHHYCQPRISGADHYTAVEVGFPSEKPQFFAEHADPSSTLDEASGEWIETYNYTDTVYGYVPVDLVEQEIAAHGGLKGPVKIK